MLDRDRFLAYGACVARRTTPRADLLHVFDLRSNRPFFQAEASRREPQHDGHSEESNPLVEGRPSKRSAVPRLPLYPAQRLWGARILDRTQRTPFVTGAARVSSATDGVDGRPTVTHDGGAVVYIGGQQLPLGLRR